MAEVTAMRHNALPYPIYGQPWVETFPLLDADGDLVTGATTPDSEVSLNGGTFADCTNEAVEIATASGVYYLILTAAEMTADKVTVIIKSATAGMKTTVLNFAPRKLVSIRTGTSASAGSSTTTIVLDASASAVDDFYNGMVCVAVIDGTTEIRIIGDYTGSTQTATISGPDWNTAPDNNDTFTILLPEGGAQIQQSNVSHWNSLPTVALPLVPTTAGRTLDVSATGEAGIDWANVGSPTTAVDLSATSIVTTQRVDVNTIKTQSVTCAAGVTVLASVGTAATSTAQTGDSYAKVNDGTIGLAAIKGYVDDIGVAGAGLTAIPTVAHVTLVDTVTGVTGLTPATVAAAAEAAILDEGDATALLAAIAAKVEEFLINEGDAHATLAAIGAAVRTNLATELGRIDVAISTRGTGTGAALDAAGVRAAVGLGTANLDTQLGDLPTNSELATALAGADDAVLTAVADLPTNAELATALAASDDAVLAVLAGGVTVDAAGLDAVLIDGVPLPAAIQLIAATTAGKASGIGTGTEVYVGLDGITTRVTATLDGSNNRTSMVYVT